MPTLRSAAALLASAANVAALAPIAALIGCDGEPEPLDAAARTALGIPDDCAQALVVRGPGTLRALLLDVRGPRSMRDVLAQLAVRLSARAPHLLWVAIGCTDAAGAGETAIAAWAPARSGARVAALVVKRSHVVDSDAETLCALAAALGAVDVLTHARWVAVLGREAVTRRFYRTLERLVQALASEATGRAPEDARREIALLYASRLLFLSFLEAKEWLDGDRSFLARHYDDCIGARGRFQRHVLMPLFFGTLNTPVRSRAPTARLLGRIPFLNGGLFARSPVERAYASLEFRDEELGRFLAELLGRYRFTAREESAEWSEAAVDPEMLGRAFESLMAARERRDTGAFFTPHDLVARVTGEALSRVLGVRLDEAPDRVGSLSHHAESPLDDSPPRSRLAAIRLLDPACGSGAFLVHALERIAGLLAALGDPRPIPDLRRAVLTSSIFGVDINPTAVWLCQLRLWLSIVIESTAADPARVAPLPNLDRNIRVGDALAGHATSHGMFGGTASVGHLRRRYARAVGVRKRTLARALDRAERAHAIGALDRRIEALDASRRDVLTVARGRDLFGERRTLAAATRVVLAELRAAVRGCRARRRALLAGGALPFSFITHFADVTAAGGFDVVIGNPPWVRLHRIPRAARSALRREYTSYRDAAWRDGATAARAGVGFAAQVDLAALFVERSLGIARAGGVVALLVPAKLWRALAGGGVRRLLTAAHQLLAIEDWSDAAALFDAAVYPSMFVARRAAASAASAADEEVTVTVHAARIGATWGIRSRELGLDDSPGAPWLLLPAPVRRAFDAVRAAGTSLGATAFGAPLLGVKCGCNGAFIVTARGARVASENGVDVDIEPELLRPLVRGEHLARWTVDANGDRLIWTHGPDGRPVDRLPPRAERWLRGWRRRLMARADARGRSRWWALFRTDAAACDVARVIWADFGRSPRAAVLVPGNPAVPLNTCYVARCADLRDAYALAALLNSPLVSAWLAPLAEPARGGYRRYLGWTMALLPIPTSWHDARALLAPVGERACRGCPPGDAELLEIVARAYSLRVQAVAPLLDWQAR